MTADDEMVFAVPYSFLDSLILGLKESGKKAGARYPVTFYQNFQPEFPPHYKALAEKLGVAESAAKIGAAPTSQACGRSCA